MARIVGDTALPPSAVDVTAIVTVLARAAGWDPSGAVVRARDLWLTARMARPVGVPLENITDPFDLEVHRPIEMETAAALPLLPQYVPRGHDATLAGLAAAAVAGASGLTVLVGDSSTGKTRACWEALEPLRHAGGWRLWHPIAPSRPEALLGDVERVGPWTVVWLNEAQEYLAGAGGERVAAALRELLRDRCRAPVLVLGTLWRSHWDALTRRSDRELDLHAHARELLFGRDVTVPSSFTPAELGLITEAGDPRLDAAAQASEGRVSQFLAGAPALLARYRNAPPAAQALADAAADARRLGMRQAIPLALLQAAAPGYLGDAEWQEATADGAWLEQALNYATEPCTGSAGLLNRVRPQSTNTSTMSNQVDYRLADYIEQYSRHARRELIPPVSFWDALTDQTVALDDLATLTSAAWGMGMLLHAAQLCKKAVLLGSANAATNLVDILHSVHPGDQAAARWVAAHAPVGDLDAVGHLLWKLREVGAGEQVTVVAERVASVSLDDARASWFLVRALDAVGRVRRQRNWRSGPLRAWELPTTTRTLWRTCQAYYGERG